MIQMKQFLLIAFILFTLPVAQAQQDELLPPEQAFKLQAWVEGNAIVAEYKIAPGYYMYRDAFQFTVETDNLTFGEPGVPDGKIKNDEFFGDVEIYRNSVAITLPLEFEAGLKPAVLNIKTAGQGCADIGVCYPPLYQSLSMNLSSSARVDPQPYKFQPLKTAANTVQDGVSELQNLLGQVTNNMATDSDSKPLPEIKSEPIAANDDSGPLAMLQALGDNLGLGDDDEIPHPDKAFKLGAVLDKNNIIQAEIELFKNTYLYRDKMKVKMVDGSGHSLGAIALPQGDEKNDEFFGLMQVYHDFVKVPIPVVSDANASGQYALSFGYQGCVEDKICYPPITKYFKVDLNSRSVEILDDAPSLTAGSAKTAAAAMPDNSNGDQQSASTPVTEQDRFAGIIANENLFIIIGSFFLAGVLLTFTPCVFPMIPILSGIIAGQGENITTRKAFTLSLVYVLAMASTYAVAGYIVGVFGAELNIQIWFQDPIILSIFAGIFVLLSLSMFGFYDLQMPSFIQSRLTEISNKQEGGNLAGVAIMGLLSALIVGPCITAPLVGALAFIAQAEDPELGGLALFALGIGMGTPLLLIGTTAGNLLPRAGTWMDAVKGVFGVGLLAVAIWLLERILPTSITMLLMASLIIVSAIYMGAIDRLPEAASGWKKLWKGVGLILLFYGLFYLYGVAAGGKDLIQPLKGISGSIIASTSGAVGASSNHLTFRQIKGESGLQQALAQSKGKPVMLDFYADWCISCKEMEKYAFTHPQVLAALDGVTTLQTDVTPYDKQDRLFLKSLGLYGPPAILFFDKEGKEIAGSRVVGEMSGEQFAAHVNNVLNN